ncbi:MAG: hypothetical protein JWM11_334 [Planctomycetaceae bacterium]|nr:hypothetical protein [Planctomycetaceae bacterium]
MQKSDKSGVGVNTAKGRVVAYAVENDNWAGSRYGMNSAMAGRRDVLKGGAKRARGRYSLVYRQGLPSYVNLVKRIFRKRSNEATLVGTGGGGLQCCSSQDDH